MSKKKPKPAQERVPKIPRFEFAPIEIRERERPRCRISKAKEAFLAAVIAIIVRESALTGKGIDVRSIHYELLNDPPLKHSSKPQSLYRNDLASYKSLIDLTTRARHEGRIEYDAIDDRSREVVLWKSYHNLAAYYDEQSYDLLNDYWRDLHQSQPNYVELVLEKNTVRRKVEPIVEKYRIPFYPTSKGQCSTTPLFDIVQRFRESGKAKLIVLVASDLDPDGDAIPHSMGQRLRDDFGIDDVEVIKVTLTMEQAKAPALRLPASYERAKRKSPNYKRYVARYGTDLVWELEAVPTKLLQEIIKQGIESVLDMAAFNKEIAHEEDEQDRNSDVREQVLEAFDEAVS